jgi:hypothetical protein
LRTWQNTTLHKATPLTSTTHCGHDKTQHPPQIADMTQNTAPHPATATTSTTLCGRDTKHSSAPSNTNNFHNTLHTWHKTQRTQQQQQHKQHIADVRQNTAPHPETPTTSTTHCRHDIKTKHKHNKTNNIHSTFVLYMLLKALYSNKENISPAIGPHITFSRGFGNITFNNCCIVCCFVLEKLTQRTC